MSLIENIYENQIQIPNILDRKVKIDHKKIFIYGPKFSGKSYIIYNYLQKNNDKKYFIIDLIDYKNTKFDIAMLDDFLFDNPIDILVLENYSDDFKIPDNIDEIIVSSTTYIQVDGFHPLHVMPLDFEEFIAFDNKHQSITQTFNSFLKFGNLPDILEYKDIKKSSRNQELLQLMSNHPTKTSIIYMIIKSIGQTHSMFWIFNQLKKQIKISKDFFYATITELESNHSLLLLPKYNQEKAAKKIYFYNYAFIDNVSYQKNFTHIFSNLIYLELFNKNYEIYYLDGIDFYIPELNKIIIAMPFFNTFLFTGISKKIQKAMNDIQIDRITIITISNEDRIKVNELEAKVIPFYEWAVGE